MLLFGPPGVGKSHLVSALGHALIDAGRRVLSTPCNALGLCAYHHENSAVVKLCGVFLARSTMSTTGICPPASTDIAFLSVKNVAYVLLK